MTGVMEGSMDKEGDRGTYKQNDYESWIEVSVLDFFSRKDDLCFVIDEILDRRPIESLLVLALEQITS